MIEKSSTLFGWHDEQNLQGPPPQFMLRRQRVRGASQCIQEYGEGVRFVDR